MVSRLVVFLLLVGSAGRLGAADSKEELFGAARKGNVAAVKALLDKGVDVNSKNAYGATALSYAADKGHLEIVKLLLAHKATVNVKDTFYNATPMTWAAYRGHADVAKALLEAGSDEADNALGVGVSRGSVELVRVALASGKVKPATLNASLDRKSTRLNSSHVAISYA